MNTTKENSIQKAIGIATEAHKNQLREDGTPYINHPIAVMKAVEGNDAKIMAVLHDVLEDGTLYHEELIKKEFTPNIYKGLKTLTRYEEYTDYIYRIMNSGNLDLINVKIADLAHNLRDAKKGSRKDKYRLAKYILELRRKELM